MIPAFCVATGGGVLFLLFLTTGWLTTNPGSWHAAASGAAVVSAVAWLTFTVLFVQAVLR